MFNFYLFEGLKLFCENYQWTLKTETGSIKIDALLAESLILNIANDDDKSSYKSLSLRGEL